MNTITASDTTARLDVPGFRGVLIEPGDDAYDEARTVYNGSIDRRPRLIARCVDVADVIAAVDFARERGLTLAVRGGGHHAAGLGVWTDALVVDLGDMRAVHVDPDERLVRVQGGALLGDVDHATHPFGLAVPTGILSTTGIAGLTLGGGLGYLSRQFGLSIDSLVEAEVVLADGSVVTADADRHPDLFWAIRGGGGNFGVVTTFTFRGHPVRDIVGGPMLFDLEDSPAVMRAWDSFLAEAPEALTGWFGFLTVPPVDVFPAELHGRKMAGIVWCHNGTLDEADRLLAPMRALGPVLDGVGEMPFPALQSAFDGLYPKGLQWYWRADFVEELTDEAIAVHLEHARRLPTMHSSMHLYPIDGAVHRVAGAATPFAFRRARYAQVIVGVDPDPGRLDALRTWTREYHDALHPFSAGGGYVNMLMDDEGEDRVEAAYGDNFPRLVETKRRYDPENLWHVNKNIPTS